jgi:hypothetical protein
MSDYAARAQSRSERALAVFLVAAAIFALVAAAVLLVPSALRVTRYEISGNASMTREDVLSAALIHDTEYFFSLDAARVKAALIADPRVASVSVSKLFPNGLRIAVAERKAVAAVVVIDRGSRLGRMPRLGRGGLRRGLAGGAAVSVPVISGIRFEGFRLGMRLPPALTVLVASLGEIQASEPALLSAISEITDSEARERLLFRGSRPRTRHLSLEPAHTGARGRVPGRPDAALHHTRPRRPRDERTRRSSVQEIDFRTGTVVYRSKEGQSG